VTARAQSSSSVEVFLHRLGESHELSVYEALERLVCAGEGVGLDVAALIGLLDQGMTFEELLDHVESKLQCLQEAS
jgi:hypothetical protein